MAGELHSTVRRDGTTEWGELIYGGVETQEIDYKAAQNWLKLSRVGKAKFARHAMAMANTLGGYVVVGVGEDDNGNPTVYTGLSEAQLRSFDPSIVAQFINLYADPSIDIDIVRPEVDGKHYAVFVIRRFSSLPHVSTDHCGDELQQGAFYIRTTDARSRPAYRASELHGLVQRALRNQRQALGRMLRGILYEGKQVTEPDAEREFQRLLQESLTDCRKWVGPRTMSHSCRLEISAYPTEFDEDAEVLSNVRKATANVAASRGRRFPFAADGEGDLFITNQALLSRAKSTDPRQFHFFQFFQCGLFHHVSSLLDRDESMGVPYALLVERIAVGIRVLGEVYAELGYEEALLTFTVSLANVESCTLVGVPGDDDGSSGTFRCYISDISVRKRRTVADLVAGTEEHALKVIHEVCERFNLDRSRHGALRQHLLRILD